VPLSYDGVVGKGIAKEKLFAEAEQAAKDLFDSGQGADRATLYLFGRNVGDRDITAAVLDQLAGLNRDVGLAGILKDKERLAELERNGVFLGPGDHDAAARDAFRKRPMDGVIKAILDVKGWPPQLQVQRSNW
jgi:hypothetical protein